MRTLSEVVIEAYEQGRAEGRREGLEEAAKAIESLPGYGFMAAGDVSAAIRKLIEAEKVALLREKLATPGNAGHVDLDEEKGGGG